MMRMPYTGNVSKKVADKSAYPPYLAAFLLQNIFTKLNKP